MKRSSRPQLITDAERSPLDELRSRQRRYFIMMGIRALCVIVAGIVVMNDLPLLPLWLTICVAGAVILPWTAVMLANDGAPKPQHRLMNRFRRETPPPPATHALPEREHKVIDADS